MTNHGLLRTLQALARDPRHRAEAFALARRHGLDLARGELDDAALAKVAGGTEASRLSADILAYLKLHPEAADSAEGVSGWWLSGKR